MLTERSVYSVVLRVVCDSPSQQFEQQPFAPYSATSAVITSITSSTPGFDQ